LHGANIERRRSELNLTRRHLADMLGVSFHSIFRWEKNERTPSDETKKKLASALHTSVAYLMGELDDPKPYESENVADQNVTEHHDIVFEYSEGDKKIKVSILSGAKMEDIHAAIAGAVCAVFGDLSERLFRTFVVACLQWQLSETEKEKI